jgi:CheY-like chemotaxis protein
MMSNESSGQVSDKTLEEISLLAVDDSEDNTNLVRAFLAKDPVKIVAAENGKVAVDLFKSSSFDLVLMDMNMPVMDGAEATEKMREFERSKNKNKLTPIIALSAYSKKEDKKKMLRAGCSLHVTKPISKKLLSELVYIYGRRGSVLIKWSEEWAFGVPQIDECHRKCIELINRLFKVSFRPTKQDFIGLSEELMKFKFNYFKVAETLLKDIGYEGIGSFYSEQNDFEAFLQHFKGQEVRESYTAECLQFLRDWFFGQTLTTERDTIRRMLEEHQREEEAS